MNILDYARIIQYPIAIYILLKFSSSTYKRINLNLALITSFLGFIGISLVCIRIYQSHYEDCLCLSYF